MARSMQPATLSEITEIVGPLDETALLDILGTGATATEVLEAFTWANDDDQIATETGHGPRGAVLRVCEILEREKLDPEDR